MKKIQLFIITAIVIGLSSMSFAQNTATATAPANAKVIKGINLQWNQNLAFGNLTTPTVTGSATIGVSGINATSANYIPENPTALVGVNSINNGTTYFGGDPNPGPAVFTVTGEMGYSFAVTLPTGSGIPVLNNIDPGGVSQLTLSNLTVCVGGNAGVPGATGTLSVSPGTQWFVVGGTVSIPAHAASGTYQNAGGTFSVGVAYN